VADQVNRKFDELSEGHVLRKFCEKWKIEDPELRQALVDLLLDAMRFTGSKILGEFDNDVE
jgi:hypothetical protein